MTDSAKPVPVKPRLPRGLADRGPADIAATRKMLEVIQRVYELYGFGAVETPFIEYTEALGKFLPDLDRPNEGVFSFQDDDEQWLSLRYDLTAPLARYVAENFDSLPKPYRSYRSGMVFRNEKPGPGRFRQFMQFDADTVGAASVAADAEICMMAADTLEALGVARGDYVIKVNNRKVLDGVMEAIGLGGDGNSGRRLIVLRAIDKLDRLGVAGVRALLGAGRKDESGDFTKGAGLDEGQIEKVLALLLFESIAGIPHPQAADPSADFAIDATDTVKQQKFSKASEAYKNYPEDPYLLDAYAEEKIMRDRQSALGNIENFRRLRRIAGDNATALEGIGELEDLAALAHASGYEYDRIRIDPSVVRGLEYYTGPVFEAELTFTIPGDDGKPVRFGSVGGGGRYDGLVGRFRGESVPATGFSIGVSRLFAALKAIKSPIVAAAAARGPVVVLVLDKDHLPAYQRLVGKLRAAGIAAEIYLGSGGMNAQLKYADKRGSACAIIQGSNEREKGEVTIKDLILGAQIGPGITDRAQFLKMKQEAQFAVDEAKMVAEVQKVLQRHP